jgi:hypothetical protein
MARERGELGEAPSPEELLAYRDGLLSPEQREILERKIDAFPQAARALADLAAFPDVEPVPGVREIGPEELTARWVEFRRLLAPPQRQPFPLARWAMAAGLLAALGAAGAAGFLAGRSAEHDRRRAAINVVVAELVPRAEGSLRSEGAGERVEVGREAEALVLVLSLAEPESFPSYGVEILDRRERSAWKGEGLLPRLPGRFVLVFDRGVLAPGAYRIKLTGLSASTTTTLAIYELELAEE